MGAAPEIRVCEDADDLAHEAADLFVWAGRQAIAASGRFRVALSGGRTPRDLYAALRDPALAGQLDWSRVEFFFGDERGVPPDHPESNFALADEGLFQPLRIPAERVVRMPGETTPAEAAAAEYETRLRRAFGDEPWPRFDLVLLGLGEDGHTASLFPGTAALQERTKWVTAGLAPTGVRSRITLTVPVLNRARTVLFLVTGAAKAPIVRVLLEGPGREAARYPASLIRPESGRLIWLLDRAAASELTIIRQGLDSHEE